MLLDINYFDVVYPKKYHKLKWLISSIEHHEELLISYQYYPHINVFDLIKIKLLNIPFRMVHVYKWVDKEIKVICPIEYINELIRELEITITNEPYRNGIRLHRKYYCVECMENYQHNILDILHHLKWYKSQQKESSNVSAS